VIETAYAVRYDGKVEQGRTSPLRVHVETEQGEFVDLILKATVAPHLGVEGLMNEMLGSLLAGDLDLPTPQPFFVELSPDFISAVPDLDVRSRLTEASPLAFGSKDAGAQWRRWNGTDHLVAENLDSALGILAFDAFVGNPDRSPRNPNLLKCKAGSGLLLIDHECAFGVRMRLFPPLAPWILGNLSHLAMRGAESEHLFQLPLAGRAGLDFAAISVKWGGLSDARFGAYDALLPGAWADARPALDGAIGYLKQLRERLPECMAELRRVIA